MDRIAEWRPVEPEGPVGAADETPPAQRALGAQPGLPADGAGSRHDAAAGAQVLIQLVGVVLLAVAAIAALSALGLSAIGRPSDPPVGGIVIADAPSASPTIAPVEVATTAAADIIVDVQGAVERPGLLRLPAGSRVGDAISAAGGYSAQVDIDLASRRINLAAPLADGEQVHVPVRGQEPPLAAEPTSAPSATGSGGASGGDGSSAGGLVNVNTASQAQLETLPGIGPVTAGKIIAARDEAPFTTVDDLLARKVVGPATMEKIRPLISVGP